MDDIGQTVNIRSVTEPSTPLRRFSRIEESFAIYSERSRTIFRTSDIHLPPHELPSITAKLSQESNSAPGSLRRSKLRSRSRPMAPLMSRGAITSLSPDRLTPTRNTDKRRSSSNFTMGNKRRKRRSLIMTENGGTAFDPNYIGPITIDYLRLFCKLAIEEKKQDETYKLDDSGNGIRKAQQEEFLQKTPEKVTPELESVIQRNSSIINDFDQSLPLPELEGMPISPDSNRRELEKQEKTDLSESLVNNSSPPRKTFSYLERILAAQAKKSKKTDTEESKNMEIIPHEEIQSEKIRSDEIGSDDNVQNIDLSAMQSHFVIEDNNDYIRNNTLIDIKTPPKIDLDAYDEDKPKSLFVSEDSSNVDGNSLNNDINDQYNDNVYDDNEINDVSVVLNKMTNNKDIDFGEDAINYEPSLRSEYLSEVIAIPTGIASPGVEELSNHEEFGAESAFPGAVVNEEYTLDNVDNNNFEESLDGNHDYNEDEVNLIKYSDKNVIPQNSRIIRNNKKTRLEQNHSISIAMVKKVVKSLQIAPINDNMTSKQKINTTRAKRFTPGIYEFIQQKSDEFILSVVSDLEAYSAHRTNNNSNQINIKDVLLYLNRIKFTSVGNNTIHGIESITNLAYKFLPLELLISLDDNLHSGVNVRKPNKENLENNSENSMSDSESDYSNEITPDLRDRFQNIRHLKAFSDSEAD